MTDTRAHFLSDLYVRHTARRLEHLASLNLNLFGRSVLELGAGIGDHSSFYLDRGCHVTAVEPRPENVEVMNNRMQNHPVAWDPSRLRVVPGSVVNLDQLLPEPSVFDLVHCYGLLYHLEDPRALIASAARRCSDLLLLETKVRLDSHPTSFVEDRENPTNSFDGPVTLMTRDELLQSVGAHMPHVYVPVRPVPHEQFPADWNAIPADQWPIRMVAIGSRKPIQNPALQSWR